VTVANQLTLLRIPMAVAMFAALMRPNPAWHLAALALFCAALATDWIDGYLARRTGTTSSFGKVADPIADKILILGALIALARAKLGVPLWGIFLLIARELLIGGLRVLASAHGKVSAAESWGKWKMGIQGVSVFLILAVLVLREHVPDLPAWISKMPYALTVLCVAASWNSAYLYYRQSQKMLENSWK
jgi:CDP-diacylglycerol--glycerol-3-phosphate 3-phosphatidyltransferase